MCVSLSPQTIRAYIGPVNIHRQYDQQDKQSYKKTLSTTSPPQQIFVVFGVDCTSKLEAVDSRKFAQI